MEIISQNNEMELVDNKCDSKLAEEKFNNGCNILYVVDKNKKYLGCITRKELAQTLLGGEIINTNSYKILHGEGEKERAHEIFQAHGNIYNIPVTDENGVLLYEYTRELAHEDFDSIRYWEERYKNGGNSGDGSYGRLAEFKAEVLNDFICKNEIKSMIEWGFGDGNQLKLLKVLSYTGYDVSETACKACRERFLNDTGKEFRHYNGARMTDFGGTYDMSVSLDVLYHLVEDVKFDDYLHNLFQSAEKYVCIYSSNYEEKQKAEHIRRRKFTGYVKKRFPEWEQVSFVQNPYLHYASNSNFYFYRKY